MIDEQKVKICFISTIPITLKTFVLPFAEYLHDHTDWDISFACNYDEDFERELPDYISYFQIKMKRGMGTDGVIAINKMISLFRREKFDLIQYSTPNASFYAAIAGKLAGIKCRLYCQWGMAFVGFSGFKRKVFKTIERVTCGLSTKIEPDSRSNLEFAISEKLYKANKGEVIWHGSACGVDFKKFDIRLKDKYRKLGREKYGLTEDTFVFGFVGRVTRDKGVNELLSAFRKALLNNNLFLFIVGDKEADRTIDSELFGWSLNSDKIVYTGYTKEVEKYLSIIDCYILPSYREGFGLGVVEAEAMRIPVIVTDIPGPRDSVKDGQNGIVIQPKSEEALYDAMIKIISSKSEAEEMGNNGYEYAKSKYEREKLFELMLEDRRNILAKKGNHNR